MIQSIRIRNFKCFDDAMIPIGPLTLLTGVNCSGKSTTIQTLLLLRQSWLLSFDAVGLNGDLVTLGNANDILSEDAEKDLIEIHVEGDGDRAEFEFFLPKDSEVFEISKATNLAANGHLGLFGRCFQYLRAERVGPRTSFSVSADRVARHRELGPSGEYTAHFLSVYGSESVSHNGLLHAEASSRSLLAQTEAWLGEISPGVQLSIAEHRDMDLVSLTVSFAVAGQVRSDPYRPTNVGFGLTYVLPVIVALLSARSGDLVIIENPEAHLHPRGQGRIGLLIALAAQAGIQVIVETHSDHILNGVRLAAKARQIDADRVVINFFGRAMVGERNRASFVSPVLDQNGRVSLWPRGFFDEWENSLDSLLT
jgi:predicted ATPase